MIQMNMCMGDTYSVCVSSVPRRKLSVARIRNGVKYIGQIVECGEKLAYANRLCAKNKRLQRGPGDDP